MRTRPAVSCCLHPRFCATAKRPVAWVGQSPIACQKKTCLRSREGNSKRRPVTLSPGEIRTPERAIVVGELEQYRYPSRPSALLRPLQFVSDVVRSIDESSSGELDTVDRKVYWEVVDDCYLRDMCSCRMRTCRRIHGMSISRT